MRAKDRLKHLDRLLIAIAVLIVVACIGTANPAVSKEVAAAASESATPNADGSFTAIATQWIASTPKFVKFTAPTAELAKQQAAARAGTTSVGWAVPAKAASNDSYRSHQYALDALQIDQTSVPNLNGIVVAVLDTGVQANHEDFASTTVISGSDYINDGVSPDGRTDPNGHGTHVAGIIAAQSGNSKGIAGVASGVKILPIRVLNANGDGTSTDIANGIVRAVDNGATVINISIAGGYSSEYQTAVGYATSHNVPVIAAAGNDGGGTNATSYPAATPGVISVAATDAQNHHASYSTHNAQVAISAPGTSIVSLGVHQGQSTYIYTSGTSEAAPHVAAIAAMIRAKQPSMTVPDLTSLIESNATDLESPGRDDNTGYGLINPVKVMGAATDTTPVVSAGTRTPHGAWTVAGDGGVFSFGGASFYGSTGNIKLNQPVVGMAGTRNGQGYWFVASDGGIFSYGDAAFYGSTGNIKLNQPIVGMSATPDGGGYWLVARDGGIFAFGNARFFGSTGNIKLNQPIVGMAATPDNGGYWLVAQDGGIFAFGDARFYGGLGGTNISASVTSMATTTDGAGYYLLLGDGTVRTFGNAQFFGNGAADAAGIAAQSGGYVVAMSDGTVASFGTANSTAPSSGPIKLNKPIQGVALAL